MPGPVTNTRRRNKPDLVTWHWPLSTSASTMAARISVDTPTTDTPTTTVAQNNGLAMVTCY